MWTFGRWVYQDEADDAGGAGGGGESQVEELGGEEGGGAPAGGEGGGEAGGEAAAADAAKAGEAPKDMKSAIDAALGYAKKPGGDDAEQIKAGEKKGEQPPAGAGKETETHHANGKPKKSDKGEDLDAEGKVVTKQAPKPKTAAELDLKPEEKKALGPKSQQRFQEVIGALKAHEATITKQAADIKSLGEARDAILGVMEETRTTQDQLVGYLQFNAMLTSGDPKQLESALQMVEQQRVAIYKALGREPEGGGVDLLAEFPDLVEKVRESQITREDALELANARRERTAREQAAQRQQQHQRSSQQTAEQQKKAHDDALTSIDGWTAELSRSDLDYKAKEDKLLAKIPEVVKNYPPNQWLPTLKLLYEGIVIPKASAAPGGKQSQPLRPSGAKPGAKAPASMKEAIDQGLGYGSTG